MQEPVAHCRIEWNVLELSQWREKFAAIPRSTLLQSYDYARAVCPINHQTARWGFIHIDGKEAGLVQILEAGIIRNLIHTVSLDRGPLWFPGFGTETHLYAFFEEFNRIFPQRPGCKRRIIPEISNDKTKILEATGYQKKGTESYHTSWLDISKEKSEIRTGFQQKWRNQLNKSLKQNMDFRADETSKTHPLFQTLYKLDQSAKDYKNIHPKYLHSYFQAFRASKSAFLAYSYYNGDIMAAALILIHGRSATWQIGYLAPEGRDKCANHFLLWNVITTLKGFDVQELDLGGFNEAEAAGVKKFKEGLNGETVILPGIYS